jgi:membrane protease YdiL (CAAX protease family)
MKRLFILLGLFCSLSLCAQEYEVTTEGLLLEILVPGYHAIQDGDWTGWLTAPGMLLATTGTGYMVYRKSGLDFTTSSMDAAAFFLTSYGNFSTIYRASEYILGDKSALSIGECLAAPFTVTDSKDILVASTLGLLTLSSYKNSSKEISAYFKASTVKYWGMDLNPYTALGAVIGTSAAISLFSTTTEELFFRQLIFSDNYLGGDGLGEAANIAISAVLFGSIHLGNLLVVKPTWENISPILEQTVYATLMGGVLGYVYLSDSSTNHKEGLQKAMMMHFWNNVLAFSLNYVVTQGKEAEKTQAQKDAEKLSMEHPSPWQITAESYPPSLGVEYRY